MAFRSFRVGPEKGLRLAECQDVPNVMVICGPNGVGKSTLLNLLKTKKDQAESGTKVGYVGPYRPWRRAKLSAASLFEAYRYSDLLELNQLPGWSYAAPAGLGFINQTSRLVDGVDEAQSLVKSSIAKIEMRWREHLTKTFHDQGGRIDPNTVPDVYEPLRLLTQFLLPHLQFERVDSLNQRDVTCLFRRRDGEANDLIDIDELSSGEKAVVALFLPYLEAQMLKMLDAAPDASIMGTTLLDEPELHLHPSLQVMLLDYFRQISTDRNHQFILTTHSPTLLDAARDDELFVIVPAALAGDKSQLVRLSDSSERLEAMRELTGSTHIIARARPIVFVEGTPAATSSRVSDQRLIEALVPESQGWSVIPCGGREQAIAAAEQLRDTLFHSGLTIPVFSLADLDQAPSPSECSIHWPVAMVENLLLDVDALWEMLSPFQSETGITSQIELQKILKQIAAEQKPKEVELRARRMGGELKLRLAPGRGDTADAVLISLRPEIDAWLKERQLAGSTVISGAAQAAEAVDAIEAAGRELEAYRGKPILDALFERHVKRVLPKKTFVLQLAAAVRGRKRLHNLVERPVRQMRQFVPARLTEVLEEVRKLRASGEAVATLDQLLADVRIARERAISGEPDSTDRKLLRARLIECARTLRGTDPTGVWHREILTCCSKMITD